MRNTLIRGGTVILASGQTTADVCIENGKIVAIGPDVAAPKGAHVISAAGMWVFPGLIDCHVHFREPGFEYKATMATEAASAVAGGVTTVCEMPNTNPPTVTVAALADKIRRASAIEDCDLRFYFGITQEAHLFALRELWTSETAELSGLRAGCCGVKLYLDHSTGNQKVDGGIVEDVFRTCYELGIPLIAHCEDPDVNAAAAKQNTSTDVATHSSMRPPESEAASITYAIGLSRKIGTPLQIAHLTTKQGIALVAAAKKEGLPITCEVTPHHLFLTTDDYAPLQAKVKMNPPIRGAEHRDALWAGIADGTVDCIATDHAPHTLEEKTKGLQSASGVPGVETMLPLLLTVAAGRWPHPTSTQPATLPKITPADILRLCHTNPNRIFKLGKRGIEVGAPADCILVDAKQQWTVRAAALHSKCAWTPFEGWKVTGAISGI